MARVEVQLRSCFCCGLSLATILIGLYTLLLYSLLTGLAAWGLSDTAQNGDASYYNSCEAEALGRPGAENRKLTLVGGHTTVVVEDSTSYHCSFGLYTEELKFQADLRHTVLIVNIVIYVAVIFASILLLVGLSLYQHLLLWPWLLVMAVDVVRGLISVFFIFWTSHRDLARIATAIFFLGLQFLHISLIMIITAKMQRIYNRKNGILADRYDARSVYPTTAASSHYGYSPDPKRDGGYRADPSGWGPAPPQGPGGVPPSQHDYRY